MDAYCLIINEVPVVFPLLVWCGIIQPSPPIFFPPPTSHLIARLTSPTILKVASTDDVHRSAQALPLPPANNGTDATRSRTPI